MNEMNPNPVPPPVPHQSHRSQPVPQPLGQAEGDQVEIGNMGALIEGVLRHPRRLVWQLRVGGSSRLIWMLIGIAVLCALAYGLVVGSFSMGDQLWAAPVKVAGGLLVSALICLPSLYIFSCLSGSDARFREVCGLVAGLLALTTVLLMGFAPVAWVFSQSTQSAVTIGVLHLLFLAIAIWFGLRFLVSGLSLLSSSGENGVKLWALVFLLVVLQMTTALRPIVGTSNSLLPTEKKFFLTHWSDQMKR